MTAVGSWDGGIEYHVCHTYTRQITVTQVTDTSRGVRTHNRYVVQRDRTNGRSTGLIHITAKQVEAEQASSGGTLEVYIGQTHITQHAEGIQVSYTIISTERNAV